MPADVGHAEGQASFGLCLAYGKGVECDCSEAALYFKMSSDSDSALQYDLCGTHERCVSLDARGHWSVSDHQRCGNEYSQHILELDEYGGFG